MASQMSSMTREDILSAIFAENDVENGESDAGDSSGIEGDEEILPQNGHEINEDPCFRVTTQ